MRLWQKVGQSKKLIEAARHWATRPAKSSQNDERLADPEEWQAAIEEHEEAKRKDDADGVDADGLFAVWPANWDAVCAFCNLRNCWRVDSWTGRTLGLDRPAIESTLRLMQIESQKHLVIFEQLAIMEDAALEVLNRK